MIYADREKVNRKQRRYRMRKLMRLQGLTEEQIDARLAEIGLGVEGGNG